MNQIIKRIDTVLVKEHFAVVQVFGSQGSGKTILTDNIIKHFRDKDYDIRMMKDLRPLGNTYLHNMVEVIEDSINFNYILSRTQILKNISMFYTKPKIYSCNLIRIIVTQRKIDLEAQFTAYRHYKESIIDVTTGWTYQDLPIDEKRTRSKFYDKLDNVFKRKLKTRPYLITTKPMVIGRYKKTSDRPFRHGVKHE